LISPFDLAVFLPTVLNTPGIDTAADLSPVAAIQREHHRMYMSLVALKEIIIVFANRSGTTTTTSDAAAAVEFSAWDQSVLPLLLRHIQGGASAGAPRGASASAEDQIGGVGNDDSVRNMVAEVYIVV
jgi:hypothetical protein